MLPSPVMNRFLTHGVLPAALLLVGHLAFAAERLYPAVSAANADVAAALKEAAATHRREAWTARR